MNNYPPGVTGDEYEIAGPDYERDIDGACPECGQEDSLLEQGYRTSRWVVCSSCGHSYDLSALEPDPDEQRDQQLEYYYQRRYMDYDGD